LLLLLLVVVVDDYQYYLLLLLLLLLMMMMMTTTLPPPSLLLLLLLLLGFQPLALLRVLQWPMMRLSDKGVVVVAVHVRCQPALRIAVLPCQQHPAQGTTTADKALNEPHTSLGSRVRLRVRRPQQTKPVNHTLV
jgi:hypothetical protein